LMEHEWNTHESDTLYIAFVSYCLFNDGK